MQGTTYYVPHVHLLNAERPPYYLFFIAHKNKYVLLPPFPLIIRFVLLVPTILSKRNASNLVNKQVTDGSAIEDDDDEVLASSVL